jgi:hypothetical protein
MTFCFRSAAAAAAVPPAMTAVAADERGGRVQGARGFRSLCMPRIVRVTRTCRPGCPYSSSDQVTFADDLRVGFSV